MAVKKTKKGKARKTGRKLSRSKTMGSVKPLRSYFGTDKA